MPLHVTPCVDGYVPVRIVARAGWHSGFCVRAAEKRVPCAANASSRGRGRRAALPSTPSVSARCWSVVMSSTFMRLRIVCVRTTRGGAR